MGDRLELRNFKGGLFSNKYGSRPAELEAARQRRKELDTVLRNPPPHEVYTEATSTTTPRTAH